MNVLIQRTRANTGLLLGDLFGDDHYGLLEKIQSADPLEVMQYFIILLGLCVVTYIIIAEIKK